MWPTDPSCSDPQEPGLTSPRREENTRMTGTWPTSSTPGTRDPVPSCRPLQYLGTRQDQALIAYKQSLGLKDADRRMERQRAWKEKAVQAYEAGPEENVKWLHSHVPGRVAQHHESLPHDGCGSGKRTCHLSELLSWLPRPYRRRHGACSALPLPAAPELHHSERQGDFRRHSLLPDHERHHRHSHALFQDEIWNPKKSGMWATMWLFISSTKAMREKKVGGIPASYEP